MPGKALPERILIVRLGAIGDVINALTVATAIKDRAPGTEIGWMIHPLAEPLVRNHPAVDHVHVVPRQHWFRDRAQLRAEWRAMRYGLVIDLQRMLKSAFLARQVGAPRLLGYDRKRSKEGAWMLYKERIPSGPAHMHMVDQYAQFAEYLVGPGPVRHALPALEGAPDEWVGKLWAQAEWTSNTRPVVVHIGASKSENRWDPERYSELVQGLIEKQSAPLLLTGGPGDKADSEAAASALQALEPASPNRPHHSTPTRFINLVGTTDLLQLMAVLRRARLFIGCDTGPMHLAAAAGAPVLALFGPADPRRTGPYGRPNRVLRFPPASENGPLAPATMGAVSSLHTLKAALEMLSVQGQ